VRHQELLARRDPRVQFTLATREGRTTFHRGERIPLELHFAAEPGVYQLFRVDLGGSFRSSLERYHVDREDAVTDPVVDYHRVQPGVRVSHERGSMVPLDAAGDSVPMDLNLYLRFDQAGRYRIYALTTRIRAQPGAADAVHDGHESPVVSDLLTLEILPPDPTWEAQELRRLTSPEAPDHATTRIGYLGTRAAALELLRRCDRSSCPRRALCGSPHRALVVAEMERLLVAPEQAIHPCFLRLLTDLSYLLDPEPRTREEAAPRSPEKLEIIGIDWGLRQERKAAYVERLRRALPGKVGAARRACEETVASLTR
jgi:hypothetical protein